MIIIGNKYIPYEQFKYIDSIDNIKLTKPNSVVWFSYNEEIMSYCLKNDINYAVSITSITQAIYANNLNARYILPQNISLSTIQKIAENYMFDSKILATIKNKDEIEQLALEEIDGVIFQKVLDE